ncbi:2OG-Fe(II) oxygenase [Aquabacterium sp.]|uniref:2OG-Fe(II) oxygenase n=1 Tax=Aquabacterium sp. TaxID=1872578 RepID=UPI003D6C98B0
MHEQLITPELRQWIIEQSSAGHSVESVLSAMKASGWHEDTALTALENTLKEHAWPLMQAGQPLPEPALASGATALWAHDREVRVLVSMARPRVLVLGGLLSAQECQEMVELARPRLARSETVINATGGSEVNVARTSEGMFFARAENELCQRIEARIAALVNWPIERGEGLQILRYGPGAEYKPHYDYFDPSQPGTPTILRRGGQRVATLVTYLNTPQAGGATVFPDIGLEVSAVAGNAVFFSYALPHPMTQTLHGGAPVMDGEKWVATKWLREQRFE